MNWNTDLQNIIDYTEHHLQKTQEPLDKNQIAKMAGCSYSFFQKVFSYMNQISFSEYVRNRKMTLAGYDLKSTDIKVVDLSYKYGYDSPTSFTKAFQQFHGMTPTEARCTSLELRVYPKMTLEKNTEYTWRLEYKPTFRLIGKKLCLSGPKDQNYIKIPEFWGKCQQDGTYATLVAMDEASPAGIMGVFGNISDSSDEVHYYIAAVSSKEPPEGYSCLNIKEATWAVFDCIGRNPEAIQKGWNFLTSEWLIRYPFLHDDCPEIEWYSAGNPFDENYLSQIWIPVLERT